VINNKEPELSATAIPFYRAGLGLSPTVPDGPALYDLVCAACHRDLENSKKKGARTDHIQRAIEKDKGEMEPLTVLSKEEIQAIADALVRTGGDD
jgi:mono/diheme cytochrome c family protein